MTESSTSARKVTAAQRAKTAVSLRMGGLGYQDIGNALGISRQAAWKLVKNYLDATKKDTEESAVLLRELELARLDELYRAIHPQAKQGNQGAVDRCLRIMERRSKLLGLDAPQSVEVAGKGGGAIEVKFVEVVKTYEKPDG